MKRLTFGIAMLVAACASADELPTTTDEQANGASSPGSSGSPGSPPGMGGPALASTPAPIDPTTLRVLYTEHLGRLTKTTLSPGPSVMIGTDLGSSFVRDGKNVFLFGDTVSSDPSLTDADTVATAPLRLPATGVPALSWLTQLGSGPSGPPLPFRLPGIPLGAYEVPVEGVPAGDTTYVFFATRYDKDANLYGSSTLAHSAGATFAGQPLVVDHEVPSARFVNVSVVIEGGNAFIFGSGDRYRQTAVHLARVPVTQIADRSAWTYRNAAGVFVAGESNAAPVVAGPSCVGELSVRKHPALDAYLMTYNCESPRGVHLHIARKPDGPWTAATRIFDPSEGYGRFMHIRESVAGYDDGLSMPGKEEVWGGEYGPYLVPSWFTREGDAFGIVYALSSWNPYQVHLVRTWLAPPGVDRPRPVRGAGLPKAKLVNGDFATGDITGWQSGGDAFVVFAGNDGLERVTSATPAKGDAAIGTLSQTFVVDATTNALSFFIHGGDGRVTLRRGDEIVRSSHGRRSNDVETHVRWNIDAYRGDTLTLTIEDDLTGTWGFVGARAFALE